MSSYKHSEEVAFIVELMRFNYDAYLYVAQYGLDYLLDHYIKYQKLNDLELDYDYLNQLNIFG